LKELSRYDSEFPHDILVLDGMIRVHLALNSAPGERFCDEHNLAVLDLVDRIVKLVPDRPQFLISRAHAVNNIASNLTNRGKTDEAESFWLDVLALREELARKLPSDKVMRYELAKCLMNYSHQLTKTERSQQAMQCRERAARLFDTLHDDAAFRATYVPLMVDCDLLLAAEYMNRGEFIKALPRLNSAIEMNSILLELDKTVLHVRANHANAHTRRAEIYEHGNQHAQAARDYQVAISYSTYALHREHCSARLVQALLRSGDTGAASKAAAELNPQDFTFPYPCLELARSWLMISKEVEKTLNLTEEEREQSTKIALENARKSVQTAQQKGLFKDPNQVRSFHAEKLFEPFWDLVPRLPE
jgi:tetratricopeptide (TPR) repeat protein